MQSHSREATVARSRDCFQILLNVQSHSHEATVTPGWREVAASSLFNNKPTFQDWNELISFGIATIISPFL